jgi:hypothetical protein
MTSCGSKNFRISKFRIRDIEVYLQNNPEDKQHLHHHENVTSCCYTSSLWLEEQREDSMWEIFSYVERNSAAVRNRSQKSAEKVK